MELDELRTLLRDFTENLLTVIEEGAIEDLYEPDEVEEMIEVFLDGRQEEVTDPPEESY